LSQQEWEVDYLDDDLTKSYCLKSGSRNQDITATPSPARSARQSTHASDGRRLVCKVFFYGVCCMSLNKQRVSNGVCSDYV